MAGQPVLAVQPQSRMAHYTFRAVRVIPFRVVIEADSVDEARALLSCVYDDGHDPSSYGKQVEEVAAPGDESVVVGELIDESPRPREPGPDDLPSKEN